MPITNPLSQKKSFFFSPVFISIIIILVYLIPLFAISIREKNSGPGIWGIFSVVALLVTIIAPVVYGWKTGDTKGAMLVGAVPFLFVMTIPRIALGEIPRDPESLIRVAAYVVPLSVIGGLEGFFAAQKEEKSILFAIILVFIWIIVLLSGLN